MKKCLRLVALTLCCIIVLSSSFVATAATNTACAYVDGDGGSDSVSTSTPSSPFLTLKQAYTKLKNTGGTIYIVNTVEIYNEMTLSSTYYQDADGKIELADGCSVIIKRYSKPTTVNSGYNVDSFLGNMIMVNTGGNVTLTNITVDGHKNAVTEGNENQLAPGVEAYVSMISVETSGTLTIDSSTIQNGKTIENPSSGTACGGAIYNYGSLNIKNSKIINNEAVNSTDGYGGAIYNAGILEMTNNEVSGNVTSGAGGGVYNTYATFTLNSGVFSNNTAVTGGAIHTSGTFTMFNGEITNNTASEAGGIQNFRGTATIKDGVISNNVATVQGGGISNYFKATLNIEGGTISENKAYDAEAPSSTTFGGGIVSSSATVNIKGGTIFANEAHYGAGIYNNSDGNLVIEKGSIINNIASKDGGGIFHKGTMATISGGTIAENKGARGAGVYNIAEFEMVGGTILKNDGTGNGGGVYNGSSSIFRMSDGSITGNTTSSNGNGFYQGGTLYMSNNAVIDDDNDVYLPSGKYITVSGALTSSAPVATITPHSYTESDALGRMVADVTYTTKASAVQKSDKSKFALSDTSTYVLRAGDYSSSDTVEDNDIIISKTYTVTYKANGGTGAPDAQTKYWNENLTLSSIKPTRDDYAFKTWNTSSSGSGTDYAAGATYSTNASLVLYAQWTLVIKGLGHKTIMVGDLVDTDAYITEFDFPEGLEIDTFEVIYNGVPRDAEDRATTTGTGYTIVYSIVFKDGTMGDYRLIITVLDESMMEQLQAGYIRFISLTHYETLSPQSKWRAGELKTKLLNTLSVEEPTDEKAVEVWKFSAEDVLKVKTWIKECDEADTPREEQNALFTSEFGYCQTK